MKPTSDAGSEAVAAVRNDDLRLAYEPPRILYREPLETIAAICSPAPPAKGNPGACPQGPISS